MLSLNTDILVSKSVLLPEFQAVHITQVGVGGTGSWLLPHVLRVVKLLIDLKHIKAYHIDLFDPDIVEDRNVYRQNFFPCDVGKPKVHAVLDRYGFRSYGLGITTYDTAFKASDFVAGYHKVNGEETLHLIIGCVDNHDARRQIATAVSAGQWWLDCGNLANHGQVLIGNAGKIDKRDQNYSMPSNVFSVPFPHIQHPDLLVPYVDENHQAGASLLDTLSCAERSLVDEQGLSINNAVAMIAADYLFRLLVQKNLSRRATYIDIETGVVSSDYLTGEMWRNVK